MRKLIASLALAILLVAAGPGAVSADYGSGSYTTSDGLHCNWSGSGTMYQVNCSGYNYRAGGYVSYSCSVTRYGTMSSYTCRDMKGHSWSGSN